MSEPVRLHPADLEALAEAVVRKLRETPVAPAELALIDAAEVARRFGVTADWARRNADRLGAVRIGDGSRPRLRFDPERVASALRRLSENEDSTDDDPRSGPEREGRGRSKKPQASAGHLPRRSIELAPLPDRGTPRRRGNAPGPTTRTTASTHSEPTPEPGASRPDADGPLRRRT